MTNFSGLKWIPMLVFWFAFVHLFGQTEVAAAADSQSGNGNGTSATQQQQQQQQQQVGNGTQPVDFSVVDDCRLHYAQLPESFTRLTAYHLQLSKGKPLRQRSAMSRVDFDGSSQSLLELERINLDPVAPFVFFTNGFNNDGVLDGTWMEDVAKVYSARHLSASSSSARPLNVIFLNWHMEGLLAESPLSAIPVYYKTMANYNIIVSRFERAIAQIFDHVLGLRDKLFAGVGARERLDLDRDYFGKFKFFGHSLGAHILSNALTKVHKSMGLGQAGITFAQIYGLDPAVPCFFKDRQGLTAARLNGVSREVVVLHSNAGLLGAFSDYGQVEIVLNGGTFQPNCTLFDLKCHHVRSTDVLRYTDDTCKLVAYKCNKFEQFKLGACETCDSTFGSGESDGNATRNCLLVNLEQQNEDSKLIESIASFQDQVPRQLADDDDDDGSGYNFERAAAVRRKLARELDTMLRNPRPEYHFANTDPLFRTRHSHCLQHYQLRLLTLSGQSCPVKLLHGDRINLHLFQEPIYRRTTSRDQISKFKLTPIVANQLHTGLGTFDGGPRLFVGALIDNIDLNSWLECSGQQEDQQPRLEFVLDVAFMSHTKKSVRHAFSSVLCAQLLPTGRDADQLIELNLCHQSELTNVSSRIDDLVRQVKFHNKFEPWHIILLNSLFSLFSGWEPL